MVTEIEVVNYLYGMGGFIVGGLLVLILMLLNHPYMRANLLTKILNRSYGCAEFEKNNMEIDVRVIKMDDDVLSFSKRPEAPRYFNNRSMYRRKLGCPTIHYNFESPNPVSFLDMVRIIRMVPTKVKIMVKDITMDGKRKVEEIKEYIVGLDQMEILQNVDEKEVEVQDERGQILKKQTRVDNTWKVISSELKNERPVVYTPTKMSDILSHYDARAEILATIQRLADLASIKNWTLYAMILSGVAVVIGIGVIYMLSSDVKPACQTSTALCSQMVSMYYPGVNVTNVTG